MNKEEQKQHLIDLMRMDEEAGFYDNIAVSVTNMVHPPNSFVFKLKQEEIIRIDEKGFYYKGELIEDAGEVYKLFKEFLQTINYKQD